MASNIKKNLKALCNLNGISGRENRVRDYIINEIKDYAEYKVDPLGNLIVYKKGKNRAKNKVMLDAHTDEVGLIVTGVSAEGFLSFAKVGGIDNKVIIGRNVLVGEKKIPGVLGIKPIHLIEKDEEQNVPKDDDMYIDIGAKNREDALADVSLGDEVTFESGFVEFGDGFIKAKAVDNRAGCAILIDLIQSELEYDCVFTFTVQEEIGTRGAGTAAFEVQPDYAIVAETTTAADISGVKGENRVCVCGDGPAVSFMDNGTVYNMEIYNRALELGKEKGIKCQTKTKVAGGNNARSIHTSRGGVITQVISLPTRYLHSPCCVCKYDDIEASRELIKALAEDLAVR